MGRNIDKLIEKLMEYANTYRRPPYGREVDGTPELLEEAAGALKEAADSASKMKARYMDGIKVHYQGYDADDAIECPVCGFEVARNDDYDDMKPKHCPECGTKLLYGRDVGIATKSEEKKYMKATNIIWDIDDEEGMESIELPTEIEIPKTMTDEEEISDYLSDLTGFCHKGFDLIGCAPAVYTSVWDGGIEIGSCCMVNLETHEVFDIQSSMVTPESLDVLEREYVTVFDKDYEVVAGKEEYDRDKSPEVFWRD